MSCAQSASLSFRSTQVWRLRVRIASGSIGSSLSVASCKLFIAVSARLLPYWKVERMRSFGPQPASRRTRPVVAGEERGMGVSLSSEATIRP